MEKLEFISMSYQLSNILPKHKLAKRKRLIKVVEAGIYFTKVTNQAWQHPGKWLEEWPDVHSRIEHDQQIYLLIYSLLIIWLLIHSFLYSFIHL